MEVFLALVITKPWEERVSIQQGKRLRVPKAYICCKDALGAVGKQWPSQVNEQSACLLQYLTEMGQFSSLTLMRK